MLDSRSLGFCKSCLWQMLIVGMALLLCSSCRSANRNCDAHAPENVSKPPKQEPSLNAAQRAATSNTTNAFKGSLEMKENADFLLTPALIVQQALATNRPIIYPSE
jgi:hypothetical protein